MSKLKGKCACGSAAAELDESDVRMGFHCFCKDCQKLTGGGKSSNLLVDRDEIALSGRLVRHRMVGESGRERTHLCCEKCGSSIAVMNESSRDCILRAGIFDDASGIAFISIFTRSANPWDLPQTEIQFEGPAPDPD